MIDLFGEKLNIQELSASDYFSIQDLLKSNDERRATFAIIKSIELSLKGNKRKVPLFKGRKEAKEFNRKLTARYIMHHAGIKTISDIWGEVLKLSGVDVDSKKKAESQSAVK